MSALVPTFRGGLIVNSAPASVLKPTVGEASPGLIPQSLLVFAATPDQAAIRVFQVEIVWDEDQWVATEAATQIFGEGDTVAEANADLFASLSAYHQALAGERGKLSPRLEEHLMLLDAVLGK